MPRTTEKLLKDAEGVSALMASYMHDAFDDIENAARYDCWITLIAELAAKLRENEDALFNATASLGYFKEENEYHKNQVNVICDVLRDISIDVDSFVEDRRTATKPTPPKKDK